MECGESLTTIETTIQKRYMVDFKMIYASTFKIYTHVMLRTRTPHITDLKCHGYAKLLANIPNNVFSFSFFLAFAVFPFLIKL